MLLSAPPSDSSASLAFVHPAERAVPETWMMIAMGSSCGRLSMTLSTLFTGSSVAGGMAGGAEGCGAAGAVAAGASGDAGVCAGFRLQPASAMTAAPTAKMMATETLMTEQDLVPSKPGGPSLRRAQARI